MTSQKKFGTKHSTYCSFSFCNFYTFYLRFLFLAVTSFYKSLLHEQTSCLKHMKQGDQLACDQILVYCCLDVEVKHLIQVRSLLRFHSWLNHKGTNRRPKKKNEACVTDLSRIKGVFRKTDFLTWSTEFSSLQTRTRLKLKTCFCLVNNSNIDVYICDYLSFIVLTLTLFKQRNVTQRFSFTAFYKQTIHSVLHSGKNRKQQ